MAEIREMKSMYVALRSSMDQLLQIIFLKKDGLELKLCKFTLMVKELTIVWSTELMFTCRIWRDISSSTEIIFVTWPGILGETVLRTRFGPENLTSTSAMDDLEFAESSLRLSIMEELEEEEVGDGVESVLL